MGDDYDALRKCIQHGSEYLGNMDLYEVWLEDEASLTAKLEFMKAFELGGAAGWEISLAAPYVWELMERYY